MTGTARNDRLVGTPRPDVVRGLAGNDQLLGRRRRRLPPRRPRPGHARRRSGQRSRRGVVRRGPRHGTVRIGARRRERRSHRCRRTRLRARRPPALARPLPERRRPARDRGRAGQLHVRAHDRRNLPGRKARRRSGGERRVRSDDRRRCDLAQRAPPRPDRLEPSLQDRTNGRAIQSSRTTLPTAPGSSRRSRWTAGRRGSPSTARRTARRGARRSPPPKRTAPAETRTSASTRTGSRATTRRRRRSTVAATSSTRTPRTGTCSQCAGRTTAA